MREELAETSFILKSETATTKLGTIINAQGLLGIVFDSQIKNDLNGKRVSVLNCFEQIIPDGTKREDTSQAIITPAEISRPNSLTISMEVVINAKNPIEVVTLVRKMTLNI